jgi:glucose/arabinose dehydrogenase
MKKIILSYSLFFSLFSFSQSTILVGATEVEVDTVYTGLDIPWEIVYGSDGYIWTTERKGIISRIDPVAKTKTVVLNLTSTVEQSSESGMLGMALHPDFENTPEVFIAYTYGSFSNIRERFVKYTFDGTSLVSPVTLIEDITGNTTHIGARFQFLPDNTLIVSTGDAQNTSLPQSLSSLSGKMLRMNTDGTIPADNPITDSYVYSFGHRNVQGIVRAPNGIIYLSEHGASSDDEFQILEVNRNYGWPNVEGFCDLAGEQTFCAANNVMEPLAVWTPTIAPSDMIWYENPEFPEFDGKILMTVLKDKKIVAIELNADGTQYVSEAHFLTNQFGRLRDICEGADKELYLATNGASWSNTNPNTHSIIRLRVKNNAGITNVNKGTLKIYPNPVAENFTLEVSESLIGGSYLIQDISGRTVASGAIQSVSQQISAEQLEKGIYEVTVVLNQEKIVTKKIVK